MNSDTTQSPARCVQLFVRLCVAEDALKKHDDTLIARAASKSQGEWHYLALIYPHKDQQEELKMLAAVRAEYDEWWYARAVLKSISRHKTNSDYPERNSA